ncbi:MAG: hypothetical protein QOK40_2899 [Miltoncostaeaceae bacterium]|jgi:RNA polymerase sigma-70 factor (ECF subfamily)|nr:hypothetical protein [Miltoncostaeaceae bacterium]
MTNPADQEFQSRFERLYGAHLAQVFAYALRRTGPEAAHDIAAETFLVAWRRIDQVPDAALPWLYGVARRVLANRTRAAGRQATLVERLAAEPPGLVPAHGPEQIDPRLVAALSVLSDDERELIRLLAWEGLDRREAAAVLGVGRPAVRLRLHRARRRLSAALAAESAADAADPPSPLVAAAKEAR